MALPNPDPTPLASVATSGPTLPPPVSPVAPQAPARPNKARRPKFALVALAAVAIRFGREILEWVARSRWGVVGALLVAAAAIAIVISWRLFLTQRVKKQGGVELTKPMLEKQFTDSGLAAPAYDEDGTLLGASVLLVNQRTKLIEFATAYDVSGVDGQSLGSIRQIGQSRWKKFFRVVTAFDQFFTHHFEVYDTNDKVLLRMTRPAKVFKSRVNVFDGADQFLGTIRQENVFGKINFALVDGRGNVHGHLRAENWRAWDFHVVDASGTEVAVVVKSWEGWARTAFSRADRYSLRIHRPLPTPLHQLALSAAFAIDIALKQDARSFG